MHEPLLDLPRLADSEQRRLRLMTSRPAEVQRCLLAINAGEAVGLITAHHDESQNAIQVSELYVEPHARGLGVMRSLTGAIERWGRNVGASCVEAGIVLGNEAALEAWQRVGYEPDHWRVRHPLPLERPHVDGVTTRVLDASENIAVLLESLPAGDASGSVPPDMSSSRNRTVLAVRDAKAVGLASARIRRAYWLFPSPRASVFDLRVKAGEEETEVRSFLLGELGRWAVRKGAESIEVWASKDEIAGWRLQGFEPYVVAAKKRL